MKIDPSYKVITGCVTDTAIDKPKELTVLTKGSLTFETDFISKPEVQQLPTGEVINWFSHYQLRSNFNTGRNPNLYSEKQNNKKTWQELEKIKQNYSKAKHGEVVGLVFHVFDYYRQPKVYTSLFKYISSHNQQVETIRTIQKKYSNVKPSENNNTKE